MEDILGLPVIELRGNINGYVAPYRVIYKGVRRYVFGIKSGDYVIPVDIEPFYEKVVWSLEQYSQEFYDIQCYGESINSNIEFGLASLSVESGFAFIDDMITSLLSFVDSIVESTGLSRCAFEVFNYSRFYTKRFDVSFSLKIGGAVEIVVEDVDKGSIVYLDFSYPSVAAVYRGIWDIANSSYVAEYFEPLKRVSKKVVKKCGVRFHDVPVVYL